MSELLFSQEALENPIGEVLDIQTILKLGAKALLNLDDNECIVRGGGND